MNNSKYYHRAVALLAVGMLWTGAATANAQSPRNVLMSMEVRGLSALTADINRVSTALQFGPQGSLLALKFDQMLGGTGFQGIDTNGTVRVVLFEDREGEALGPGIKPAVVMVPLVGDGRAFLDALEQTLTRAESASPGVHRFVFPASGARRANDLLVAIQGDQAVLGPESGVVGEAVDQLRAGVLAGGTRIGVPGSLAVDLNMAALARLLETSVARMPMALAGPEAAGLQGQMTMIAGWLKQVAACQLGLNTDAAGIVAHTRLVAMPGTEIGRVLGATRRPADRFERALPGGLFAAQVGHVGEIDTVLNAYVEMIGAMGTFPAPEWQRLMGEWKAHGHGLLTGDYASGLGAASVGAGWNQVYVFGVRDASALRALVDRNVQRLDAQGGTAPGVPFTMLSEPARQHAGIEVQAYRYRHGDDPALEPLKASPMAGMLQTWTNLLVEMAFVDDLGVVTMGDPALMNATLDRLRTESAGPTLRQEPIFVKLAAGDGSLAQADQLVRMSLVEYVRSLAGMMMGGGGMLALFPASDSGLVGWSTTRGNTQTSTIKLGFDELAALKGMAPFLMMGAGMGAAGGF